MAKRPLPSFIAMWQRHEELYCGIFRAALQELSNKKLTGNENNISLALYPTLNEVCFHLGKSKNIEIPTPNQERPISPVIENELDDESIGKRPDFTCNRLNPLAESPEEHEIPLHVECKRLGQPRPSWKFNEKYVTNGIKRFDSKSHEYGKRASSGLMIGYIISMEPKTILDEVNHCQKKELPDNPCIKFTFENSRTFQSYQGLKRKTVKPSDFNLIHIWADLRWGYDKKGVPVKS
jgi:hypothetical protein